MLAFSAAHLWPRWTWTVARRGWTGLTERRRGSCSGRESQTTPQSGSQTYQSNQEVEGSCPGEVAQEVRVLLL